MMRRSALAFLTASVLVHGAIGGGGAWLAKHAKDAERAKVEPKPVFTGETFDIAEDFEAERRSPSDQELEGHRHSNDEGKRLQAVETARQKRATSHGEGTTQSVEAPLAYGALGDRSAVDVTVALSRGFPQAASPDPIWRTVALGDAGSAILEIELAEDGTLARWSLGAGASPALRQAITRTMAFIGGRTFLARGRTTKLHVSARVGSDAVRDGSDAVYAIHSEHEAENASAYFSLAIGRRVDLAIAPVR